MRPYKELAKEDRFVRELADRLNVPLYERKVKEGEIYAISRAEGRSTEEVAREYRYDFFHSLLSQFKKSSLLLGHNMDDQFETIIIRFFQGSGMAGLKGIPPVNGSILRPLIHVRKSEIIEYLNDIDQSWCVDPSNKENDFLRNRVRNNLIPVIEEIFPGMEKSLLLQEKRFTELDEILGKKSDTVPKQLEKERAFVSIDAFNHCDSFVRRKILYELFDHLFPGRERGFRLPSGFFQPLLQGDLKNGKVYGRAHGVVLLCNGDKLFMKLDSGLEQGFSHLLGYEPSLAGGVYRIVPHSREGSPYAIADGSPLFFRSSRDGDTIETGEGKRKLKEVFRSWGVDVEERYLIPVLEDSLGIVAVLGELRGYGNIHRNKKVDDKEKFNILYLEVGREK